MPTKRISENIIGITKGVITVLEILPFTRGERSLIKVKCKCGNIKIIEARHLAHHGPHSILNKTISPIFWFFLGVLTGLIVWLLIAYCFHLFNPMP